MSKEKLTKKNDSYSCQCDCQKVSDPSRRNFIKQATTLTIIGGSAFILEALGVVGVLLQALMMELVVVILVVVILVVEAAVTVMVVVILDTIMMPLLEQLLLISQKFTLLFKL
ncbi:MAG: hypothetical protein Ct9H300mP18_00490 [Candidatus Neomarinimicrobiota bacterium]|nr:MAG: hypothetical protein Ct9H300mP18_00490 [Candidatus Neomarinimicrobiota bacterium]